MHMGDLGNVEIKTQLQHQQLRAEISVEHAELGHVLSGEMPGLEQRLRDQNIPLASVIVRDQSAGTPGRVQPEFAAAAAARDPGISDGVRWT